MTRPWTTWKPSVVNPYSGQTGDTFARHESASPAVSRIEELFVAPKHFQVCAGQFLPANFIIKVSFPRRRLPSHEIQIKCRPTKNAVTRREESMIARRRHGSKTVAAVLGRGCQRTESENLAAAR